MEEEVRTGTWIGNLKEWSGEGRVEVNRMAEDRGWLGEDRL